MIGSTSRMRKTMAAQLALGLALLLTPAAAQATLTVNSDGAGLLVRDRNGDLNDNVSIVEFVADDSTPRWRIGNAIFDLIRFDAQNNCEAPFTPSFGPLSPDFARCDRFSPRVRVELRGGNDRLRSGSGEDEIDGGPGGDVVDAGSGNDSVAGREGADVLVGGRGIDSIRGNEDSDLLTSKEPDGVTAVADSVTCGAGFDTVVADLKDVIASSGCQEIDRSPVGETPHVVLPRKALNVDRSGVARVRLRCPRRTTIGCRGTLSLRLAKRGIKRPGKTRYAIRGGRSATVRVRLTAAEARRVRGRGILTSVERGKLGPKTTIRQPRLRN